MINLAIIDDVQEEREMIYEKLVEYFKRHDITDFLIDMFECTEIFLNSKKSYYGVFVDIRMPLMDGFSSSIKISKLDKKIKVILISSFDEYVFDAIHNPTYEYIRKNKINDDINFVMNKMMCDYQIDSTTLIFQNKAIRLSEVIYFESDKNYVDCYCKDDVLRIRISLKQLINMIDNSGINCFYRINKSIIINMSCFLLFNDSEVILEKNISLPIAFNKKSKIKKDIINYIKDNK